MESQKLYRVRKEDFPKLEEQADTGPGDKDTADAGAV